MCKNSLLSSDSLPLQRLFISGLHSKGRHNMDKIFDMESMDCGMEKIRKPVGVSLYGECCMCLYDWLLTNYSLLSNSSLIPL